MIWSFVISKMCENMKIQNDFRKSKFGWHLDYFCTCSLHFVTQIVLTFWLENFAHDSQISKNIILCLSSWKIRLFLMKIIFKHWQIIWKRWKQNIWHFFDKWRNFRAKWKERSIYGNVWNWNAICWYLIVSFQNFFVCFWSTYVYLFSTKNVEVRPSNMRHVFFYLLRD